MHDIDTPFRTDFVPGTPRLAVDRCGAGELVVFLHGIGGNRTNWHDQLPVFGRHFHTAAWDARGYGLSDDYDGPLAFSDMSHDLKRLIEHYKAPRAHLVGLSMGGRIAMDFHALYPGFVKTLTLCDTHSGFARLSPEERAKFLRLRQQPLLAGKEPKDIAPAIARTLLGKTAQPAIFERLVSSLSALHKESYLKAIAASQGFDRTPSLSRIRVPAHVVVGADDSLTPPEMAEDIARRIPGAALTMIPDAGHLSNIERPAAFNEAVLGFLLRHRNG
ncbi:MAG: alpha/beta fold hydrolase [Pseudomonadota bacterium]